MRQVCDLYAAAPALQAQGIHLVSTDEQTGIQAREHAHPTVPMQSGRVARQEQEDIRHGTQCLIANVEIATGTLLAPSVGATRTEADCAAHIAQTIATDPQGEWIFILDQLNPHKSEALVRVVAAACAITADLGVQGASGSLQSMATRATFLQDPPHRIRVVYTPKHTSWLNQVELWFSILVRRLLKRGSFTSIMDLRERILAFIAYWNQAMAKPFKWTYRGRPFVA